MDERCGKQWILGGLLVKVSSIINQSFKFDITPKTKQRAMRKRIHGENLFVALLWCSGILFAISVCGFFVIIFHQFEDDILEITLMLLNSTFLIISISARALVENLGSRWIGDRLNEKLWVQDGVLYHFIQKAFSSGFAYRMTDDSAIVYMIFLASIKNARYDPKSGRIEFNACGKGIAYKDYTRGIIEKEWPLTGIFTGIFYDYTEPSLYEYLLAIGVEFEKTTIKYKFDGRV